MSGFVRLIEDGRLMYWSERIPAGPVGFLLKGHVENHPFVAVVPERSTLPCEAPSGGPRLALDNTHQQDLAG